MTTPIGYTTDAPLPSPGPVDDRALHAFRELVRAVLPQLALLGVWEYRVDVGGSASVTCSPVDPSLGLPGGVVAQIWPSVLGEQVAITAGQRVLIGFVNGDAGRAVVLAGDPSTRPATAALLGPGAAAARVGDAVAIDAAQILAAGLNAGGTPVTITPPATALYATITTGSSRVTIG